MAVEYMWNYGPMKVESINGLSDVVTGIHWVCVCKDLERSETLTGVDSGLMLAPEPDPNNYVTLDSLTAEIVDNWIEQSLDKTAIEERCLGYLENQLQPPIRFVPVPGSQNSELETINEAVEPEVDPLLDTVFDPETDIVPDPPIFE